MIKKQVSYDGQGKKKIYYEEEFIVEDTVKNGFIGKSLITDKEELIISLKGLSDSDGKVPFLIGMKAKVIIEGWEEK